MNDLLRKFNSSSHNLLEKAIRSKGSQVTDLKSVEDAQIKAFEDQCADMNSKNPDLFAAMVNELKFWMDNSRAGILWEQAKRKEVYRAKMSEVVKSPRSQSDIIGSSDNTVQEILGGKTEKTFIDAFKNELKPDLDGFIQVKHGKSITVECDCVGVGFCLEKSRSCSGILICLFFSYT